MSRFLGPIAGVALLLAASRADAQSTVASSAPSPPTPAAAPEALGTRIGVSGAVLFGVSYLCSALAAGVGLIADSQGNKGMAGLFVPVAGPFMLLAHPPSDAASGRAVVLVMDGVAQVGGVAMLVVGLVMDSQSAADPASTKVPTVVATPRSVSLSWRF